MNRIAALLVAASASCFASATSTCYQAIDPTGVTFYRSHEAPVDLSMRLGDAIAKKYPRGTHVVMSESAKCPPLDIPPNYLTRASASGSDMSSGKKSPKKAMKKKRAAKKK